MRGGRAGHCGGCAGRRWANAAKLMFHPDRHVRSSLEERLMAEESFKAVQRAEAEHRDLFADYRTRLVRLGLPRLGGSGWA